MPELGDVARLALFKQQEASAELVRALLDINGVLLKRLEAADNNITALMERVSKLESDTLASLDPRALSDEQLQSLGEEMYERGSLKETIGNAIDYHMENEWEKKIETVISNYVANVEVEVECSAYINDRN
jgi:hypothetical protein